MNQISEIILLATMDCEPVRSEVPEDLRDISVSGPGDRDLSERAIRGYIDGCASRDIPVTLFLHPEVAAYHTAMLLDYEKAGHCLGLHLHPYKLADAGYRLDLGAYSQRQQEQLIGEALRRWRRILGHHPAYFRGGYFSANDATYDVLERLGFRGGSISIPGRVLPAHRSVWAGAAEYPHRADTVFRQRDGTGRFIEVPVSVDYRRPVKRGAAGEAGFEWPYLAASGYDFSALTIDIVERFRQEAPGFAVFVIDVHNDQDFSDPQHPASRNLRIVLDTLFREAARYDIAVRALTLQTLCERYARAKGEQAEGGHAEDRRSS